MSRNQRFRLMENNFAALTTGQVVASSELASFPATNAYFNPFRSRQFKFSGRFTIGATNKTLYINDGSDKSVDVTEQDYTTPALLATEIQTQLNSISSNWTVTYDLAGGTYRFTIANSGSVTLRLSQSTNAIWTTIGYTTTTDLTGTSFIAYEQRNHYPSETITFDLGYNVPISFFGVIGALDEVFPISDSASIKLLASNLNQWDSPPLEITLTRLDGGIFKFLDDLTLTDSGATSYRFWRFEIIDIDNPLGPQGISIGHIYLGDYYTLSIRNITSGYNKQLVDPSERSISEQGAIFFDRRTKYRDFSNIRIDFMDQTDRDTLEDIFQRKGLTEPLYISLDPLIGISSSLDELTAYVVFDQEPKYTHIKTSTYSVDLKFREVL